MTFRCFEKMFEGKYTSVIEEAANLSRSLDWDEQKAGVAFLTALMDLSADEQVIGKAVPRHLFSPFLRKGEAMFFWTRANHILYLTYIKGAFELRALMACNEVDPEDVRARKAASRHNAM